MEDNTRQDIRRLLKSFGIQADEAIMAHVAQNAHAGPLHVRIVLEDLTDYGHTLPIKPLHVEIEGEIQT